MKSAGSKVIKENIESLGLHSEFLNNSTGARYDLASCAVSVNLYERGR